MTENIPVYADALMEAADLRYSDAQLLQRIVAPMLAGMRSQWANEPTDRPLMLRLSLREVSEAEAAMYSEAVEE